LDKREVQDIYNISQITAQIAGNYLLKRFSKGDANIKSNFKHDTKLDVDTQAEDIIIDNLRKHFPDSGFLCEESGDRLKKGNINWIIDPLDGTVNFSRGIPHFCTSIALKENDTYLIGVIFDPVRNEIFSALRGNGAFLNNKPIVRQDIDSFEDAVIAGGFFKHESIKDGMRIFERIVNKVKKVRFFGSAALDLCYLASGRIDGYVQYGVNEWDIAAASLICELSGVRVEVLKKNNRLNVIAADSKIFDKLKQYTL